MILGRFDATPKSHKFMNLFELSALLISLAAVFGYVNAKLFRLPTAIGIMLIAILLSGTLVVLAKLGITGITTFAHDTVVGIEFDDAVLGCMLSFLLFAGALHVNLGDLRDQKWIITALASFGLLLTTAIVGVSSWYVFRVLGMEIPFTYCLVFGALISPTDPVAVMGILRNAGAPKSLETKIVGESLFNDGIAVVVFIVLAEIAGGEHASATHIAKLFVEEALGGALLGLPLGYVTYLMLRSLDSYAIEVLLTLGLVMGGYALATRLHLSGPIAMVVAGLLIGNQGRVFAMSEVTREHLDMFWELVDEVLNAVLFLLIGFELLAIVMNRAYIAAGLICIAIVLAARWISVVLPVSFLRRRRTFSPGAVTVMTWGGLHGGISVALVLSLPPGQIRDALLTVTYLVVVFSIVVQGLTVGRVVRRVTRVEGVSS